MPLTLLFVPEDGGPAEAFRGQITLAQGEVWGLPRVCSRVRVVSGQAWVSVNGQDIVLHGGESVALAPRRHAALVSSLTKAPLILEYQGTEDLCVNGKKGSCWKQWLRRYAGRRRKAGSACA